WHRTLVLQSLTPVHLARTASHVALLRCLQPCKCRTRIPNSAAARLCSQFGLLVPIFLGTSPCSVRGGGCAVSPYLPDPVCCFRAVANRPRPVAASGSFFSLTTPIRSGTHAARDWSRAPKSSSWSSPG